MKKLALAAMLLGALASSTVLAHGRGRVSVGIGFGFPMWPAPYWSPYWYPPHYSYYPHPVVVAPASPPVYVERSDLAPAEESQAWWYYCDASRGYYPYMKTCPTGWQRVPPTPEPGR